MTTAGAPTSSPPRRLVGSRAAEPPATTPSMKRWGVLVLACLALAAVSLLAPSQPTYDPWAWLIWGRDIVNLDLVTERGPSWKPLPVLFTTPFALLGDDHAPPLWLVVARAGGMLALAMAYRLAARVAGPLAGVLAAGSLALADLFVSYFGRGNSEGLLVGLALSAFERHLDGRPRQAFLLGVGCALLRPEVWPLIALYGCWLLLTARHDPRPLRAVALVLGSGAAVALLWFVPEYVGSGNLLRAASRALEPVPDSPAQADHPFLAVFENSSSAVWPPAYGGAVLALLLAVLRRERGQRRTVVLVLAGAATLLMVEVAVLAEIGFTGNLRYVALPASLVCVLGGIGWARLLSFARERAGTVPAGALAALLAVAAVPFASYTVPRVRAQIEDAAKESRQGAELPRALVAAGGTTAVRSCGRVRTGPFETQVLAWHLRLHQRDIGLGTRPPATLVAVRGSRLARAPGFRTLATTRRWVVRASCGA